LRLGRHGRGHVANLPRVDEAELESHARPDEGHLAVRAAVYVVAAHDVVARGEQLQHAIHGGESRREGKTVAPAFERGDVALERFARRVARAGVFVTLVPPQSVLDIRGRLIDRRHHGAGEGVGDFPGVHGAGCKARRQAVARDLGPGWNASAPSRPWTPPTRYPP